MLSGFAKNSTEKATAETLTWKVSGVKAVSWANDIIGKKHNTHEFNWGTMEQGKWTYLPALYVNPEFQQAMDIELLAGRWFSRDFPGDDSLSVIINETFARQLHPDDPAKAIGDRMDTPHGEERVIGVAKDFAFDPLFKAVQPFVFDMTTDIGQWLRYIYIRTEGGDPTPVIEAARKEWNSRTTQFPFEYQFLDDQLDMQYEAQGRLASLVGIFSLLVGATVRSRRPHDQATLHFFWLSVAFFGVFTFSFSGRLDRIDWLFYWADQCATLLLPPLFVHFALVFPERPRRAA